MAQINLVKTSRVDIPTPKTNTVAVFIENDISISTKDSAGNVSVYGGNNTIPKSGSRSIPINTEELVVTFASPFSDATYKIIGNLRNTVLISDSNVSPCVVISKSAASATFRFTKTDDGNYFLDWIAMLENDV